jgi:hypothetical protein
MFPDQPNRASIYGVSYPTRDVRYSLIPDFGSADPAVFSVGLLHANVNGNAAHEAYASCTVAELSATGIDYWARGHIHHRDILSQPVPWAVYPGNSQGRHPNERGARGVYLVDVSDSRQVSLEFRATDVVRWENIEIDIGGMSTQTLLNEIDNRLTETRDDAEGRPVIVRIALQGRGLAHHELRRTGALDDLVDDVNETWAGQRPFLWCNQITSSTGAPIDRAALLHGNDFIGDLLRLVDESLSTHDALHQFQGPLEDLYTNARARQYLRDSMPDDDTLRELIAEAEELCLAELIDEGAE